MCAPGAATPLDAPEAALADQARYEGRVGGIAHADHKRSGFAHEGRDGPLKLEVRITRPELTARGAGAPSPLFRTQTTVTFALFSSMLMMRRGGQVYLLAYEREQSLLQEGSP